MKCVIIGGGFAGLSAAAYLSKSNIEVEVIEAAPKLGGRAYSFRDKKTSSMIDNGQHIMMGCYNETLSFLKMINAEKNISGQNSLEVNFADRVRGIISLKAAKVPYPLNLLLGLLRYCAIPFYDRLKLAAAFSRIPFLSKKDLSSINVRQWLEYEGQTAGAIKAFWQILAVGALNTNIDRASALMFVQIIKQIFFRGNFAATIILPNPSLYSMYCEPAKYFIESSGGKINLSESVERIEMSDNKANEIITSKRRVTDFDYIISSVPYFALEKYFPQLEFLCQADFQYSSILNVHIWHKSNNLADSFFGFIDSDVHWVFNHGDYLSVVISDADRFMDLSHEEIFQLVVKELKEYLQIKGSDLLDFKVVKERRATFIPSKETHFNRPSSKTKINNFFLAGDWIDTGLPSTIESAVKSGRMAAGLVLEKLKTTAG